MDNTEGVLVLSGTMRVTAGSLSPVSCEVQPPWIRYVCPAHPTDDWTDLELENLEAMLTPGALSCSSNHFFFFFAGCIILLKEAYGLRIPIYAVLETLRPGHHYMSLVKVTQIFYTYLFFLLSKHRQPTVHLLPNIPLPLGFLCYGWPVYLSWQISMND